MASKDSRPNSPHAAARPGGSPTWPPEVREVIDRSVTAEFASLTLKGAPVTVPVTPYVETGLETVDVSTGLTYPAKAERARDPRVCLLFADPVGTGLHRPTVVMLQGLARVRDADLQSNTDRYVRLSMHKLPAATSGVPRFALRRMAWYFARIWIEVTPLHMKWWATGDLDHAPSQWNAPQGTAAPLSDPAPAGSHPKPWLEPPSSWRESAEHSVSRFSICDLTTIDTNGFPSCVPAALVELERGGFRLGLGVGAPPVAEGPACLSMHGHEEVFRGQENRSFLGSVSHESGSLHFRVDRALAHWSLPGGRLRVGVGFLTKGRKLAPRLRQEAGRRFQPVPMVRFPDEV